MKVSNIIKAAVCVAVIVLLSLLGYRLLNMFIGMFGNVASETEYEAEEDYVIETPEPMPTMPDYMKEDSFYDNAENPDIDEHD